MNFQNLHIVKIGGKLINDARLLENLLLSFSKIKEPKLLIHGGGKKASELSTLMGVESNMINGRRITNADTLEVVIMVYAGLINKQIVAMLQGLGINALGITGADGNLIRSHKRPVGEIDYGFVGDIDEVNQHQLDLLLKNGLVPVIAPITHNGQGQLLNTNADTIAAQTAKAMTEHYNVKLSYCFEFEGVLSDPEKNNYEVIPRLRHEEYRSLLESGQIHSGMIPKLDNCFDAVLGGVTEVFICGVNNLLSKTNATQILHR